MWKLLKRSGKPGWFCLIPFYNDFITLKIVGMRYRALIVFAIPILYIIPTILFYWRLTLISKRGTAFFFGLVFLSIIFLPILAFSPVKEK